jgi:hypothetical protein
VIHRVSTLASVLLATTALAGCPSGSDPPTTSAESSAPTTDTAPGAATPSDPAAQTARERERAAQPPPRAEEPVADLDLAVRLGLVPPEPVRVSMLLTHPDIREIVRYDGELAVRPLDGIAASPTYNATRLAAGDGYGFALQLWRLKEARQVIPRFERLRDTWIIATPSPTPVGDASFFGEYAGIRHLVFSHRASRSVAAITCQASLCTDEHAQALAERILSRL